MKRRKIATASRKAARPAPRGCTPAARMRRCVALQQEKGINEERRRTMTVRDLIPWNNRGRDVTARRAEEISPFLALHREMSRAFDDVLRSFNGMPFGSAQLFDGTMAWPHIEL